MDVQTGRLPIQLSRDMEELMPRTSQKLNLDIADKENLKAYVDRKYGRRIEIVGRRTGVLAKSNVRKDSLGFDDLEEFWKDEDYDDSSSSSDSDTDQDSRASDLVTPAGSRTPAKSTPQSNRRTSTPSPFRTRQKSPLATSTPSPSSKRSVSRTPQSARKSTSPPQSNGKRTPPEVAMSPAEMNQDMDMDVSDDDDGALPDYGDNDYASSETEEVGTQEDESLRETSSPSSASKAKASLSSPARRSSALPTSSPMSHESDAEDEYENDTARPERKVTSSPVGVKKITKVKKSKEEEESMTKSEKKRQRKEKRKQRILEELDIKDLYNEMNADAHEGSRRSKRKKWKPLDWWRNERLYFERRQSGIGAVLPTVSGYRPPDPTPKKPKRVRRPKPRHGQVVDRKAEQQDGSSRFSPLKKKDLPKDRTYAESTVLSVWSNRVDGPEKQSVVMASGSARLTALPITGERPEGRDIVPLACQAFNVKELDETFPGFIAGDLVLPPQAIKDAEGVGSCSQIFYVSSGQPQSVELAIASPESASFDEQTAQRILLSPGDTFLVPPSNIYRLENLSKKAEAKIHFTLIKAIRDGEGPSASSKGTL